MTLHHETPNDRPADAAGILHAGAAWWASFLRMGEIGWTRAGGPAAIAAAQAQRCDALLHFARTHSAFYRDAWRDVPASRFSLANLPPVDRRALMARFDDWVTDPGVRRDDVVRFLADRSHIGERYLDRYAVWKSSGSSGEPGIYVQDEAALSTCDALLATQLQTAALAGPYAAGMVGMAGRAALVAATGDHYASIASWLRAHRNRPWSDARAFSIMEPLPTLVAALNDYRPAFLGSYPTLLVLLAEERAAGRLEIAPSCLWSGGECLAPATAHAIEAAFGCPVVNEYGASECMSIAFSCPAGALHVNADWVVLEPVDRDHRPTPPGERSDTVLLTHLANRVQPIIRYDLGDAVVASPTPCACGSPLPAIRVEGRRDDIVTLVARDGRRVRLSPLALATVVEEACSVHRFQIVQTAADRLALRLPPAPPRARRAEWRAAERALRGYLTQQALPDVDVVLDRSPPVVDARSGKLRGVDAGGGFAAHDPLLPDAGRRH